MVIILLFWKFFTPVLTDGFQLESEWQQVFSRLQDASYYSDRSEQRCSLDGFNPDSYFQVLQSLYQFFGNCTECANYNWFHCHFIIIIIFPVLFFISFNPSLGVHLRARMKENIDYMYPFLIMLFLSAIFQSHWLYPPNQISCSAKYNFFCFPYKLV